MSARLLERVERLATERFGQGAAVELGKKEVRWSDQESAGAMNVHVCTVWRPDGTMALRAETNLDFSKNTNNTRTGVLRLMLNQLQAEEART